MTYEDAVAYLSSFTNYEHVRDAKAMSKITLERMQHLCRELGDPQRHIRCVLVAGTNGKGSICAMLYSMLRESGLRAGLYTSPHLEQLRERIRVWTAGFPSGERVHADDWIGADEFASIMDRLRPILERMRQDMPEQPPTYFEVLTALAFVCFSQRQVQAAVLEVGLGGRLDATNVADPVVSVIAPIDLDHAEILGADVVHIAQEKAGIIKPRQIVITAPQSPDVLEVLRAACDKEGVPLLACGKEFTVSVQRHDLDGLQVMVTGARGIYESLDIPLLGRHQAQNAAVAVAACEALSPTGVPHALVERGLANVEWPGRLEVVHDAPLVLMDGAHNAHAAGALADALEELCADRRIYFLVGVSSDKAVEGFGERLGQMAVGVTCTQSRHPRALNPTMLAKRLLPMCRDVHVMSDAADAYTYLLNAVSPQDVVVVTGSLFLVGELRAALRKAHVAPSRKRVRRALTVAEAAAASTS